MGSSSLSFVAFGIIVAILYQLWRSPIWRQAVLLMGSLCFLSTFSHDYRVFIPFIAFLTFGYVGLQAVRRSSVHWFLPSLINTSVLFFWLKKYSFVPSIAYLPVPYLTVGLSYILFRILHLMIDTESGLIAGAINPLRYGVYMLNFTTLVSGPIQKYPEFESMIDTTESTIPPLPTIGLAIERIVRGFFKTNVLALLLSDLQINALAQLAVSGDGIRHLIPGVVAFGSYPFFLYFNFSGYIDIVIGIALLMGITLPENFNRPFSAESFLDFWTRWHMTLSEWLKNYVYNPLVMVLMRRFPSPALAAFWGILALFVTFFLIGVWHGQTAAFLFYGVLLGLGCGLNRMHQILMSKWLGRKAYQSVSSKWLYVTVARGLTFTFFAFSLLWFWASWSQIGAMFRELGSTKLVAVWFAIFLAATVLLGIWEVLRGAALSVQLRGRPVLYSRYWRTAWDTALLLIAVAVSVLANQAAPEIVYKAF